MTTNKNIIQSESMQDRLSTLRGQPRPRWTETALLILELKNTVQWPFEGAKNYTEWVTLHSREYGVGESTLRSYVLVAEYYINDLSPKFRAWSIQHVPFDQLPEYVGPEMLVDLKKIAKIGSAQAEEHFARLIMSGSCRYADIRNAWHAYRKTFKTDLHQRGRLRKSDIEARFDQRGAGFEAQFIDILLTQGGYRSQQGDLIESVVLRDQSSLLPDSVELDCLLAVKDPGKELCLHAVEIVTAPKASMARFVELAPYFDKLWLAVPAPAKKSIITSRPAEIGVLEVHNHEVRVVCEPAVGEKSGAAVDVVLRRLLRKKLL